jgi:hypothetical protein
MSESISAVTVKWLSEEEATDGEEDEGHDSDHAASSLPLVSTEGNARATLGPARKVI